MAQEMRTGEFAIAACTAALPIAAVAGSGWIAPAALACGLLGMVLAAAWLARKCAQRLGGYTGDCLGAVQQLTEAVFYLGVLAAWS
jgi:adenosylcobinamide-GDP ribazoletransferase